MRPSASAEVEDSIRKRLDGYRSKFRLPEHAEFAIELNDLEAQLLIERDALAVLVSKYHVPLVEVLDLAVRYRLMSRFENPYAVLVTHSRRSGGTRGTARTRQDIKGMPDKLWAAADFLEAAGPLLRSRWISEDATPLARLHLGPYPWTGKGERYEAWLRTCLPEQISAAVLILRKAMVTVDSLNWKSFQDFESRPVFSRGRRGGRYVERAAARELRALFVHEANEPLLTYVGHVLRAIFPNLETWHRKKSKRLDQRVVELMAPRTVRKKARKS